MGIPSVQLLNELRTLSPHMWHIIATATSTSLGQGHHWLPSIYRHATRFLPKPTIEAPIPIPKVFEDDPLPRRKIVRQMKETINKSIILIGIPKCIEAGFAFDPVIDPADNDALAPHEGEEAFLRQSYKLDSSTTDRGIQGLRRVYQHNLDPILARFGGLTELRWLTINTVYGIYVAPCRPWQPSAPLSFPEKEAAVLSCLVSQFAHREVLWHLRGALRSGLSKQEVENIQIAIEKAAIACGASPHDLKALPRVHEVTDVDDLS